MAHVDTSTAFAPHAEWKASSYTAGNGNCVEAAVVGNQVGVRDSKNVDGPALVLEPAAFAGLVEFAKLSA